MRFLFPLAIAALGSAQLAAAPAPPAASPSAPASKFVSGSDCRDASKQFARDSSMWRYDPLKPHKLGELPPAEAYAAVYRLDENGCMVPVKFRDVRR